jgi:hypothetical protein
MDENVASTQRDWVGAMGVRKINEKWFLSSDKGILILDNSECRKATEEETVEYYNYLKKEEEVVDEKMMKAIKKLES